MKMRFIATSFGLRWKDTSRVTTSLHVAAATLMFGRVHQQSEKGSIDQNHDNRRTRSPRVAAGRSLSQTIGSSAFPSFLRRRALERDNADALIAPPQ